MELHQERTASIERFADALRGAQAGVWEWTLETDLLTWSPEMSRLTGIPEDVAPTRERFFERLHPEDRKRLYVATVHAVDVTSELNVELRLVRPEGVRWITIRAHVVREGGKAVRLVGLAQDITEQRKLEARYQRMANLVPVIVWTSNPSGRNQYANARWAEITGKEFVPGSSDLWADVMHPDDLIETQSRWRRSLAEAIPYEARARYRMADGAYRWYLERAEPVFDEEGKVEEWFGTSVDIHDRTVADLEWRQIIDSMPQIAWAVNPAGEVDFLNRQYLEYCGLGPDARGEKGWREVVHPEDRNFAAEYSACVAARRIWARELRLRRHDGIYRWHLSRLVPMVDTDGKLVRWFGTSTDIHDQKSKEEALALLVRITEATLTDPAPDSIMVKTDTLLGKHLGASRCAHAAVDPNEETFRVHQDWGPDLPSLRGGYRLSLFGARVAASMRGGVTLALNDISRELDADDGGSALLSLGIQALLVCPLIKGGRLAAMMGVFSNAPRTWCDDEIELVQMVADRSWSNIERARSERALRELNLDLERRVAERTRELIEANREMEGFTYTVAHDLRAPLRAITATSMMLVQDASEKLCADEIALLERQAHNAKRLGTLIDDLLKLSRLSREEVRLTSFNLSELAQEVMDELVADGRAAHVQFQISPGMEAYGDPRLVRFVLLNLLENACKFSKPQDGAPCMVRIAQHENAFSVSDKGIGFDKRYVDRLFRPFERLVTEAEFPGTGIGLANVKRIVERHGGSVWADSEPGHGATFWFTLASPEGSF